MMPPLFVFPLLLLISSYCVQISVGVRKSASETPALFLGNKKCRLVISELNIYPAGGNQYIELTRACTSTPSHVFPVTMANYKLIFMDHAGNLIGVCQLGLGGASEAYRKSKEYITYTIGAPLVSNRDQDVSTCEFAQDTALYNPNRFPLADVAPVAVALLYSAHIKPKNPLDGISLKKYGLFKFREKIDYHMEQKIRSYMVDMYIYVNGAPHTGCSYFKTFVDHYENGKTQFLREWAQLDLDVEWSLSRCNLEMDTADHKWDPFRPELFFYAPRTPGDLNACEHKVKFRIEDTQTLRENPRVDFSSTPQHTCFVTTSDPAIDDLNYITSPINYYQQLKSVLIKRQMTATQPARVTASAPQTFDSTQQAPVTAPSMVGSSEVPIDTSEFEAALSESVPHIWNDCKRFEPMSLIEELRKDRKPKISPDDILSSDKCYWFQYILPATDPPSYQCRLCNQLSTQKIIFDRPGSPLLKMVTRPRKLTTSVTASQSKRHLAEHQENPLHTIAVDYYTLVDAGLRGDALMAEFKRPDGPYRVFLKSTANDFVWVFQCVKLDIPFFKFPIVVETSDYFGIPTGHLYRNAEGYKLIVMSISQTLHDNLVYHLLTDKPAFGLMVDTSTDISSVSAAAFLIQTFDDNGEVTVGLYKVIEISGGHTGENLFQIFKTAIEEDGLLDYVQEKAVGFSSDGGSDVQKFKDLFVKFVKNPVISVHCFAHRLELVVKHAWGETRPGIFPFPYLKEVDDFASGTHTMFNSRSSKKKEILLDSTNELGQRKFEYKRMIPTRWITSKMRALFVIVTHFKTTVTALQGVSTDPSSTFTQKNTAGFMLDQLYDANFIATMAFVVDVCETISTVSQTLQRRGTTLITKKEIRDTLVSKLTLLKTTEGERLQGLMALSTHPQTVGLTDITLESFLTKPVILEGLHLLPASPTSPNLLSNQRGPYIDAILREIKWYFPEDSTDHLEIFNPRNWPAGAALDDYGNSKIQILNRDLRWNIPSAQLKTEWKELKTAVTSSLQFSKWQTESPESFWSFYLHRAVGITLPDKLRLVIKNILTVPASTAEVERIFSFYTQTKTYQRYSLTVKTIDAILRVRFNGPDLKDFEPHDFVKDFILRGHSRADDKSRAGSKRCREVSSESEENTETCAVDPTSSSVNDAPAESSTTAELDDWEYEFDGFM